MGRGQSQTQKALFRRWAARGLEGLGNRAGKARSERELANGLVAPSADAPAAAQVVFDRYQVWRDEASHQLALRTYGNPPGSTIPSPSWSREWLGRDRDSHLGSFRAVCAEIGQEYQALLNNPGAAAGHQQEIEQLMAIADAYIDNLGQTHLEPFCPGQRSLPRPS